MLTSKPTRYGAGIIIFGDCWDFENLNQMIHRLSDGMPFENTALSNFVLALAYDFRKAYTGQRITNTFEIDESTTFKYVGIRILWPHVIPQVALIRYAAGFHPTSRRDQANLFLLEDCLEESLREYDPKVGSRVFELLPSLTNVGPDYYTEFFSEMTHKYLFGSKPGKTRFKQLPKILTMLSPASPEYQTFAAMVEKEAEKQGVDPHGLVSEREWPKFEW